ncbi:hypothetical protein TIFTF001_027524 [Ficus carica]|uniref:Uncharacterized protein n=1 Tax=Ficus carica TaxID=3494 RepID=A0AA88J0C8_FICCA|nr:hypothetical protein TIFTF001_027524 [Ficus carica]
MMDFNMEVKLGLWTRVVVKFRYGVKVEFQGRILEWGLGLSFEMEVEVSGQWSGSGFENGCYGRILEQGSRSESGFKTKVGGRFQDRARGRVLELGSGSGLGFRRRVGIEFLGRSRGRGRVLGWGSSLVLRQGSGSGLGFEVESGSSFETWVRIRVRFGVGVGFQVRVMSGFETGVWSGFRMKVRVGFQDPDSDSDPNPNPCPKTATPTPSRNPTPLLTYVSKLDLDPDSETQPQPLFLNTTPTPKLDPGPRLEYRPQPDLCLESRPQKLTPTSTPASKLKPNPYTDADPVPKPDLTVLKPNSGPGSSSLSFLSLPRRTFVLGKSPSPCRRRHRQVVVTVAGLTAQITLALPSFVSPLNVVRSPECNPPVRFAGGDVTARVAIGLCHSISSLFVFSDRRSLSRRRSRRLGDLQDRQSQPPAARSRCSLSLLHLRLRNLGQRRLQTPGDPHLHRGRSSSSEPPAASRCLPGDTSSQLDEVAAETFATITANQPDYALVNDEEEELNGLLGDEFKNRK